MIWNFKGRIRYAEHDFIQMGAADVSVAFFFSDGLQKFLDFSKPVRIQDQSEFIRPSAQDIVDEFCKFFGRAL